MAIYGKNMQEPELVLKSQVVEEWVGVEACSAY